MIDLFGGSPGIINIQNLEGLVGGIETATYYQEFTIFEMAAKYGFRLVTQHCFVDGNKRVGSHVMLTYLDIHGIELAITDKELEDITLSIARGEMSNEDELAKWLESKA